MAHRTIWRCKQRCTMEKGCTFKSWGGDMPRSICLFSSDWIPCWERYEPKKGQKHLDKYGGGDYE